MGEVEIRIAGRFLEDTGLELPLSAEEALRAADLLPVVTPGPALLEGFVLRYDPSRCDWESEVWELVCVALLRRYELPDRRESRVALARALGFELATVSDEHTDVRAIGRPPPVTAVIRRDSA